MKNKKLLALVCCMALLVGAVGATLAWLTDQTQEVTNTFTTSDIDIELTETTGAEYQMIPGHDIAKDPKAKVLTGSEECYLFVKIQENGVVGTVPDSDNDGNPEEINYAFGDFLEYAVANEWTPLVDNNNNSVPGVYWIKVDGINRTFGTEYSVLEGDKVTVKGTVTKEMMDVLQTPVTVEAGKNTLPTLTFTAYASQLYTGEVIEGAKVEFTPSDAWKNVQP